MSSTLRESSTEREGAWYWDTATVLGALPGIVIGLQNIPAPIEGIPFVQVVPALLLGGLGVLAVDLLRVAVAPRRHERGFIKIAGMILLVSVLACVASVLDAVKRVYR